MPGFTHLQVAQPVTFGHHLLAYDAMLARDSERLADCRRRVNRLPLGSAALAGTSFPIDREQVARELGFDGLCTNSLDAVSDRDFAIEFAADGALLMMHLSRFAEELVLWSSPRFGFVRLADRFCTGSSIMPQKKNPDVPELVRGKTGRVVRRPGGAADADEGAAARLQQGQPGGQGAAVRHRRHAAADTLAVMTDAGRRTASRSTPSACAPRRAKAMRRRPTSPTTWSRRACRSATRTRRLRARCATPSPSSATWPTLSLAALQRFSPLIERRRLCGAHARRLGREPQSSGRHRAGAGARRDPCGALRARAGQGTLAGKPSGREGRPTTNQGAAMSSDKLAFLGLGVMGFPMAGHLARAGHSRHRLQPDAGQGGAVGREVRQERRRRRRRPPRPTRVW